jgi:hypothetical protein
VAGFCEHSNEISGFMKGENFFNNWVTVNNSRWSFCFEVSLMITKVVMRFPNDHIPS